MIDRDAPAAKCFAFNKQGQRCSLTAAHFGNHSHVIEWDDEDCWTPGQKSSPIGAVITPVTAEQEAEVAALGPVPVYGEGTPGRCVLCGHAMHGMECSRCDCKSGIPG